MTIARIPLTTLLRLDALACAVMGAGLALGAGPLARLTALPEGLLIGAGVALLPVGAFIVLVARGTIPLRTGARMVVLGNLGWVLASLGLLASGWGAPNALGQGFVAVQALAVAALAALEHRALGREACAAAT